MVITWLALTLLLAFQRVLLISTHNAPFRRSLESDTDTSEVTSSCSNGWFTFGDMCYKVGGKKRIGMVTWETAEGRCREDYEGNLASIHSTEQQDFLTTFLLLSARESLWIGLHDPGNESEFVWSDGSPYDFKHWEPSETADQQEDCVGMVIRSGKKDGKTGDWNDVKCGVKRQYICQRKKGKTTSEYHDPRYCKSEQGGGMSYESSCFHLVTEPKTWSEAEKYCAQEHQGHLATVLDFTVNLYLASVFSNRKQSAWIGIKIKAGEEQQKWTSGWYVSYQNWEEKPMECVVFTTDGKWSSRPCKKEMPFICEYSTVTPPVLKPGPKGRHCPKKPKGWRDLGGDKCYFFDAKASVSWPEANFRCMRRGGTLASIHSKAEVDILHNFVKYTAYLVHIGLYRHMGYDDDFAWADGSPVDFKYWAPNEDSSVNEQCVEVWADSFEWNDVSCGTQRGYICSVPKITANTTLEANNSKTCSSGFSTGALMGVIFCVLCVSILMGVLAYYFRVCDRGSERIKKTSGTRLESPSAADKRARYRSEIIIREDATLYENLTD